MNIIRIPSQDLIEKIGQVDSVEFVTLGSNPLDVYKIMQSLPKDFVVGKYSVQDVNATVAQNLPAQPTEKNVFYKK